MRECKHAYSMFKSTLIENEITNKERHRRETLSSLACDLIRECAEGRLISFSASLFIGVDSNLMHSFLRLGFTISRNQRRRRTTTTQQRRRCNHIVCRTNQNNNKYQKQCAICLNTYCNEHCTTVINIVCSRCSQE